MEKKVISKEEVTSNLINQINQDKSSFLNSVSILTHGQKNRLLEAMVSYPLIDSEFSNEEPELRVALATYKRISDSLVAIGTEFAIEGILSSINNNDKGEVNVEQE